MVKAETQETEWRELPKICKKVAISCHFLRVAKTRQVSTASRTYERISFQKVGARLRQADYSKRVAEFAMETQAGDVLLAVKLAKPPLAVVDPGSEPGNKRFVRREMASVEEVNF